MQAPSRHPARVVVMASGTGSNLQSILDACAAGELDAEVVAVVSDKDNAYALKRAADAGVPSVHVGRHAGEDRADYDARLADIVSGFAPDLIVLAGWMRILTNAFLGWFPNEVINLHPALPGELPGTRAIERAWHEALAGERTRTGVTVHRVPDEGVDDGPVLASVEVPIHLDDTFESLQARIHAAEHRLLVETIKSLVTPPGNDTPPPTGSRTETDGPSDDTKATPP
jgi:formyltetrahydrofolate-dependent phosphoribosylglycinamide formyltransferase